MSNNTNSTHATHTAPKSWRAVVLEALHEHRGSTLGMAELYAAVEAHPEYAARSSGNKDPRARIRQTCQQLRDEGLLVTERKGSWRVPENPTV
jgi:hypothetical protein